MIDQSNAITCFSLVIAYTNVSVSSTRCVKPYAFGCSLRELASDPRRVVDRMAVAPVTKRHWQYVTDELNAFQLGRDVKFFSHLLVKVSYSYRLSRFVILCVLSAWPTVLGRNTSTKNYVAVRH